MKRSTFRLAAAPWYRADSRVALTLLAFATGRSGRFQAAFVLLLLLALLYGIRHDFTMSTYRRAAVANPFFVAFSGWFFIAVAWANDLVAGLQEAAILATGWLALGFCRRRLATDRLLWSVLAVGCAMAIADLLLFSLGFQFVRSDPGDLAGLVASKNHASFLAAMSLCALFALWRRGETGLAVGLVWATPLLLRLWLGNSEAAIGVIAFALPVQLWLSASGRHRVLQRSLVLLATGVVAVAMVIIASQENGESASDGLDGRLPLWAAVWEETTENPVHGWGPGVWRSPEERPARTAVAAVRANFGVRTVAYAHSTYLDILLQTGWIGLTLFVAAMVRLLHRLRDNGEVASLVVGALVAGIVATRFPNDLTTPILLFAIGLSAERPDGAVRSEEIEPVAVRG